VRLSLEEDNDNIPANSSWTFVGATVVSSGRHGFNMSRRLLSSALLVVPALPVVAQAPIANERPRV
jgi:hypothetical protein